MKKILSFILSIALVFTMFSVNIVADESSNALSLNSVTGDVDGSGKITSADVLFLKRHLTEGYAVSIDETAADVNFDGALNLQDVICLKRIIVGGWEPISNDIVILFTNDVHCGIDENIGYSGLAAYKKYCEKLLHFSLKCGIIYMVSIHF